MESNNKEAEDTAANRRTFIDPVSEAACFGEE